MSGFIPKGGLKRVEYREEEAKNKVHKGPRLSVDDMIKNHQKRLKSEALNKKKQ